MISEEMPKRVLTPDGPPLPALRRYDIGVTRFWSEAAPEEQQAQRAWLDELAGRGDVCLGAEVFVSRLAAIYPDHLRLGDRTYVAAHSLIWGDVELGADCTLNLFTEVRGQVRVGDGVRVGAHTSILGFNHAMATDRPIFEQPLIVEGITIGDDVWIGSHVVILDGVSLGDHSVIAAGAVVTKDVTAWSIVGGNPARTIRDRRGSGWAGSEEPEVIAAVRGIGEIAATEVPALVVAAYDAERDLFRDQPGSAPTVRAWCDAVELIQLFGAWAALPVTPERVIAELRDRQDPETGLLPETGGDDASWSADGHAAVNYNILCAGNALELLGSRFAHPVHAVDQLSSPELLDGLERQPWSTQGWRVGAWVDAVGTAFAWNRKHFGRLGQIETLLGWLTTRCRPATGLWGGPAVDSGWLEPINGFYRLTRGTYAQFGVPLPYPERVIDSVLTHAADGRYFGPRRGTACNVLDVIHPLWLAARQTSHRHAEGERWARAQLQRISRSWAPGAGFSFALERGEGWQQTPGLLGTEMWLAITWLLADYLQGQDLLGYRPAGIHRPEPALSLRGRED